MSSFRPLHALTIDVEDYFQVGVFQGSIGVEDWDTFECRVERNLDRILELLDARAIKATFFVLGWVAERYPDAVARLSREGHEVGSHGFHHQPLWRLTPDAFREDLRRSLDALEAATAVRPDLYRAPCFSLTPSTSWAFPVLREEGIHRDSSIFPVHHPEYGWPAAPTRPHRILVDGFDDLVELPLRPSRLFGAPLTVCGGGWFRLVPYGLTRKALLGHEKKGESFVFYLHPWELDPGQPRLTKHTGATGRFRHYVNLGRTEGRFSRLLDDFRFGTVGQVLENAGPGAELPRVCYDGERPI